MLAACTATHADTPVFPESSDRKHIEVLSSDAFEGRAPGTAGEQKTLACIEQQFRAAGLQPGIGDSYLQPVPVVEIMPHADAAMRLSGAGGKSLELRSPDGVVVWTKRPVPASGIGNAGVVYAGYGLVAPEYGWNDYAGLDVRGKLALAAAGMDFGALKQASSVRGFQGQATNLTASMSVRNDVRNTASYNVVGRVPGSKRPDEAFVYTAHWDHLGRTANAKPGEDAIFNGAQDNATGVSALIELGRAFAATKPAPERSLIFVAVTAEESGLLGSEYVAAHPPILVAQMVGGLNMDNLYSVGKTRDITVIGFGKSELEDDLRTVAAGQGRVPVRYTKAGIDSPTLGAEFGKQWLADYTAQRHHQVTDEYSADWDVSGTLQDLQLYYDVGLGVANSSRWPNWRADREFRAIRDQSRK